MDTLNNSLLQITTEDFAFLIKNGKRNSKILNFDFESVIHSSWSMVKETIPELFTKNDFEQLLFLMLKDRGVNCFLNDVSKMPIQEAMSFILWIIDEMKSITELEGKYLQSTPDAKMMQAGINNLDKFGHLNTLDHLSGGNILNYDKIRSMPYNVIFDKQYLEITKSEIEKKLAKIK